MLVVSLAAQSVLAAQTLSLAALSRPESRQLVEAVASSSRPNDYLRTPMSYLSTDTSFYLRRAIQNVGLINWSPLGFVVYEGSRASVDAASLYLHPESTLPLAEAQWLSDISAARAQEQLTIAESVIDTGGANCLARAQNRELSRKDFHCFTQQNPNSYCQAIALRGLAPRLETWKANSALCYLHTTARDERHPWSGLHGNIICMDEAAHNINKTLASDIGFVFPNSSGLATIQFDFASPKFAHLNLDSFAEITKTHQVLLPEAQSKSRMPVGPVGLYGCIQGKINQFLIVPGDVYLGRQLPMPLQPVWETDGETLKSTTRNAVETKFKRFDQVSPWRCAREPSIDAVCGFGVVAAAAQIAFEAETVVIRMALPDQVRMEVFDKLLLTLQRVNGQLQGWPLQRETQQLIRYFSKQRGMSIELEPLSIKNPLNAQSDADAHEAMIEHLNLPSDVYSKIFP